jgi:hypothetical protein
MFENIPTSSGIFPGILFEGLGFEVQIFTEKKLLPIMDRYAGDIIHFISSKSRNSAEM